MIVQAAEFDSSPASYSIIPPFVVSSSAESPLSSLFLTQSAGLIFPTPLCFFCSPTGVYRAKIDFEGLNCPLSQLHRSKPENVGGI